MNYKYINLFSGIGGWELGLQDLPMENVLSCEIDKHARNTMLDFLNQVPLLLIIGLYICKNSATVFQAPKQIYLTWLSGKGKQ